MRGVKFRVRKGAGLSRDTLAGMLAGAEVDVRIADGPAPDALQLMEAAVVSSGTATLETALCEVPMVVIYRTSWPTYLAARAVVRIPHIAMVNVLAGRAVVPELIQHRATPARIAREVIGLLRDDERAEAMRRELRQVVQALGPPGAVDRAAGVVLEFLQ